MKLILISEKDNMSKSKLRFSIDWVSEKSFAEQLIPMKTKKCPSLVKYEYVSLQLRLNTGGFTPTHLSF